LERTLRGPDLKKERKAPGSWEKAFPHRGKNYRTLNVTCKSGKEKKRKGCGEGSSWISPGDIKRKKTAGRDSLAGQKMTETSVGPLE